MSIVTCKMRHAKQEHHLPFTFALAASLPDLAAVAFWAIVSAADPPTVPRRATMSRKSAGSIAGRETVFWPHRAENIRRCLLE
jgi:hypothetical protein